MEIDIARVSVADLGFPTGALTREIIGSNRDRDLFGHPAPFRGGRARQLGLELCKGQVAVELRIQYADQPLGECLHVAMVPITSSDGEPRIFSLAHKPDGKWLDALRARPDDFWEADAVFVFSLGIRWDEKEAT